jgi:hypothetical protein
MPSFHPPPHLVCKYITNNQFFIFLPSSTCAACSCSCSSLTHTFMNTKIMLYTHSFSFTDITIELRALGVPWTLHCWMHALAAAHELRLDTVIDQLLQDFLQVCPDDYSQQFVTECLPLLFSIFRYSKVCVSNNFIPIHLFLTSLSRSRSVLVHA